MNLKMLLLTFLVTSLATFLPRAQAVNPATPTTAGMKVTKSMVAASFIKTLRPLACGFEKNSLLNCAKIKPENCENQFTETANKCFQESLIPGTMTLEQASAILKTEASKIELCIRQQIYARNKKTWNVSLCPQPNAKPSLLPPPPETAASAEPSLNAVPENLVLSGAEIVKNFEGSIYKLHTRIVGAASSRSHGTAFAVDKQGHLATNFHVVADALEDPKKYELIVDIDGQPQRARVVALDSVNDLAVVRINKELAKYLTISSAAKISQGETLYSLGFPKSEGLTVMSGLFNGERVRGFSPILTTSIPLNPGMSGGPTFNTAGEVIGVNRAILLESQNISYLSPLKALQEIIQRAQKENIESTAEISWRHTAVNQVLAQEKNVSDVSAANPTQKIGAFRFTLPIAGLKCGQDSLKSIADKSDQFLLCETSGLSLLNPELESLKVQIIATESNSLSSADPFKPLESSYAKTKKLLRENKNSTEKCGFRNVHNGRGVKMRIRYCTFGLPHFERLFVTYIKMDIRSEQTQNKVRIAQLYQGLSLEKTTALLENFIGSIEAGDRP